MAVQRAGNRDNDSGNPAEQKYGAFQKVACDSESPNHT